MRKRPGKRIFYSPLPYQRLLGSRSIRGQIRRREGLRGKRGRIRGRQTDCFPYALFWKVPVHIPAGALPALLEQRGRAILNAAPVRQNLPKDVLEQLRANAADPKELMNILKRYCEISEPEVPAVPDVVLVQPVDLRRYDGLVCGKPVNAHAC